MSGPSKTVKQKAARLAQEGRILSLTVTQAGRCGEFFVEGDSQVYLVRIQPWRGLVTCQCKWMQHRGSASWPCSHVLAVVAANLNAAGELDIPAPPRDMEKEEAELRRLFNEPATCAHPWGGPKRLPPRPYGDCPF